jgi:5-methylcytosine-specific restriction endonuclease McrA
MTVPRPFDFTDPRIKQEARFRQANTCACCGESLSDFFNEFAHHVVANQSGDPRNPEHGWIRQLVNCVLLCEDCHNRVHQDGKTRFGAMAPPDYFPYSHGADRAAHRAWVREILAKQRTVWPGS